MQIRYFKNASHKMKVSVIGFIWCAMHAFGVILGTKMWKSNETLLNCFHPFRKSAQQSTCPKVST